MASIDYFARDFGDDDAESTQTTPKVDYFARDFGSDEPTKEDKKTTGEKVGAGVFFT
jgi:hypothetical protein